AMRLLLPARRHMRAHMRRRSEMAGCSCRALFCCSISGTGTGTGVSQPTTRSCWAHFDCTACQLAPTPSVKYAVACLSDPFGVCCLLSATSLVGPPSTLFPEAVTCVPQFSFTLLDPPDRTQQFGSDCKSLAL